uniref:Immunoglobulin V-set domain-containing protein n=1 Tax=Amphilophus citrinellus TaxID=61819 RepID=A0A3Q0SLM4_AMPCI
FSWEPPNPDLSVGFPAGEACFVPPENTYEGYSESISCPYESQYQNNLKYICKGNQPSTCLQQALITSDTKQNGRIRFNDDTGFRIFTVNITSLTQNDSGTYLCVTRNGADIYTEVELKLVQVQKGSLYFLFWFPLFRCSTLCSLRCARCAAASDLCPRGYSLQVQTLQSKRYSLHP